MKRLITVLLFCLMLVLGACFDGQANIRPASLSKEQEEILDVVADGNEDIMLYDFDLGELKRIEVWAELYENGEMVQTLGDFGMVVSNNKADGRLIIKNNRGLQPSVFVRATVQGATSHNDMGYVIPSDCTEHIVGWTRQDNKVNLRDGQEVLLYASLYMVDGGSLNSIENYQSNPETLREYDFALLIKCRLSKAD